MQFLSTKCISATKKKKVALISFSAQSKIKSKDVKKDLKKPKELACTREGIRVHPAEILHCLC